MVFFFSAICNWKIKWWESPPWGYTLQQIPVGCPNPLGLDIHRCIITFLLHKRIVIVKCGNSRMTCIFLENVKIPTLCLIHPSGLTLIKHYILRWKVIIFCVDFLFTFCANVIPFCISITFCGDPSYILR